MVIFTVLSLAILGAAAYGDYIGFWGSSPESPVRDGQIKVACIGDSITYGMRVKNRRHNCYPALLQRMLGQGYNVRNYGLNNRNAMLESPYPYCKEKQFEKSKDFLPDIVLLMLGTNDSKKGIWKDAAAWRKDYEKLVESYQQLPGNPKLYLLTPAALHRAKLKDGSCGFSFELQDTALKEICNTIWKVAKDRTLEVIDLNAITSNRADFFYKDGVHPNSKGAKWIAEEIFSSLTTD